MALESNRPYSANVHPYTKKEKPAGLLLLFAVAVSASDNGLHSANADLHLDHVLDRGLGVLGPGLSDKFGVDLKDAALYDVLAVEVLEAGGF